MAGQHHERINNDFLSSPLQATKLNSTKFLHDCSIVILHSTKRLHQEKLHILFGDLLPYAESQDSSVGTATDYGLDGRSSTSSRGMIFLFSTVSRSRDGVVGIATSYGLDDRGVGVRVPVEPRTFSSPRRPDRLWGPPNLSNGYWELFSQG
jgi:hypothetical protein